MEVASVAEVKPKPKLNKKAVEMAKQEPKVRAKNFSEVALGYTEAEALEEASRCLCCPNPLCRTGCPVEVPIPTFVKLIKEKKYAEGIAVLRPKCIASCLRTCMSTRSAVPKKCVVGKMGDPISIGRLERFLADWKEITVPRFPQKLQIQEKKLRLSVQVPQD
jgi:glutamate synthase (NADPH/NADH) small chain